jgi:hypothetical protein
MADEQQLAAARAQMALAEHQREVNAIVEVGQANYGNAVFDEASQVVAAELGDRVGDVMLALRQFDKPADILVHLSNNPNRLKQLAKLNPARQVVELARIEAQMTSNGHTDTGADPAWKLPSAKGGRVSDEEWHSGGDNLSDQKWHKEFDRRMKERNGQPLVSREAERAMAAARQRGR